MHLVKYRSYTPGLNPRRTKLEVPGWGGQREPRKDGSMEQAWHCLPFSEGARYGVELFYPYENELRVSVQGGKLRLDGDFGAAPDDHGGEWPPFRTFGDLYYTYQVSLDLKVEEGFAIRTEPHPRFYTDPTEHDSNRRARPHPKMVADGVLSRVQVSARRSNSHIPAGRALRSNLDPAGGGRSRHRSDVGRGGSRTRAAIAAHFRKPQHPFRRNRMEVGDQHGL